MKKRTLPYSFTHVHVADRDLAYFTAVDDKLEEIEYDHALIITYNGDSFKINSIEDSVVSAESPRDRSGLFCIGPTGIIYRMSPDADKEDLNGLTDDNRGVPGLRCARFIGDTLFAAGMERVVYRRDSDGNWRAIDNGVADIAFATSEEDDADDYDEDLDDEDIDFDNLEKYSPSSKTSGFLAIDGHSGKEIYAVGYNGEIWSYNGEAWFQETSPFTEVLTAMAVAPDGQVHVAGLGGRYLIGRNRSWKEVDHQLHEDDFWGLTVFNGKVYSATQQGIFVYTDNTLQPVDTGLSEDVTYSYLDSSDGVMWSAGPKHLLRTTDGITWAPFDTPLPE